MVLAGVCKEANAGAAFISLDVDWLITPRKKIRKMVDTVKAFAADGFHCVLMHIEIRFYVFEQLK